MRDARSMAQDLLARQAGSAPPDAQAQPMPTGPMPTDPMAMAQPAQPQAQMPQQSLVPEAIQAALRTYLAGGPR